MVRNQEIEEFLEVLSSKAPVPGGGGTSAVGGSIGVSLGCMAANLTIGKKKFIDVEEDLKKDVRELTELRETFLRLADKDEEVFLPLSKAYGLPRETEKEIALREKVMETCLYDASMVPLSIMESAECALRIVLDVAEKSSKLSVSDAGVAGTFLLTALKGASLNVIINLKSMKREEARESIGIRMNALLKSGEELAEKIETVVKEKIGA